MFKKWSVGKVVLLIALLLGVLIYVAMHRKLPLTMVTSISSDGQYALSSTTDLQITLWNLKTKAQRVVSTNGNLYSPYFIKNSHNFIYQREKNNAVVVENVKGEILKTLHPGFPTYGQVMTTDLKTYVASDMNYNVYKIIKDKKSQLHLHYCVQDHHLKDYTGPLTDNCTSFYDGKLLNFTLSSDDSTLFGSGYNNLYIWNLKNNKGKQFDAGGDSDLYATLSPDNRYIVGGNVAGILWDFPSGKKAMELTWIASKKVIPWPKNFPQMLNVLGTPYYNMPTGGVDGFATLAMKFISKDYFFRIPLNTNWAILYKQGNPKPLKYFDLGINPAPGFIDSVFDENVDTSWQQHILVAGQFYRKANGDWNPPGIIVYRYDPQKQTLTKLYSEKIPYNGFRQLLFNIKLLFTSDYRD